MCASASVEICASNRHVKWARLKARMQPRLTGQFEWQARVRFVGAGWRRPVRTPSPEVDGLADFGLALQARSSCGEALHQSHTFVTPESSP